MTWNAGTRPQNYRRPPSIIFPLLKGNFVWWKENEPIFSDRCLSDRPSWSWFSILSPFQVSCRRIKVRVIIEPGLHYQLPRATCVMSCFVPAVFFCENIITFSWRKKRNKRVPQHFVFLFGLFLLIFLSILISHLKKTVLVWFGVVQVMPSSEIIITFSWCMISYQILFAIFVCVCDWKYEYCQFKWVELGRCRTSWWRVVLFSN